MKNKTSKSITKVILTNDEGIEHEITEFIENCNALWISNGEDV